MSIFSENSPFILHDSRKKRWAVPYHMDAIHTRTKILFETNIEHIKAKTILDLGCHFGTWSYVALQLGARHVTGLDSDRELIGQAQDFFTQCNVDEQHYEFKISNLLTDIIKIPSKSVDTIFCLGLLYYLPDPYFILNEMKRIAREAIILDTFTAYYCAVQGKDAKDILARTTADTFELPLLFHMLTQADKANYEVQHIVKKTNKELTFLACPTLSLFEMYFGSLGFKSKKMNWASVLKNPYKTWQAMISKEGKATSHWTDIYATNIRVSYVLTLQH